MTKQGEVEIDGQGRICKDGRPLRNREKGKPAFQGKQGKLNPKQKQLTERQKSYDSSLGKNEGYKRPGSIRNRGGK